MPGSTARLVKLHRPPPRDQVLFPDTVRVIEKKDFAPALVPR
jgi:hypothetical protein